MIALPAGDRSRVTDWLLRRPSPFGRDWLVAQRWFGGKSRAIDTIGVTDVVWLGGDSARSAVVILEVTYADGARRGEPLERYAAIVGVAGTAPSPIAELPDLPGHVLIEASSEAGAIHEILAGLADMRESSGVRGGRVVRRGLDADLAPRFTAQSPRPHVRPVGHEQSNTSVRIDADLVFKLIRRLQAGPHPQLEIGGFLARAGFPAAPPLRGSVSFETADGDDYAIGTLEGWVENQGDGWRYVLTALAELPPADADLSALNRSMNDLGVTTAAFHVVLASDPDDPAFSPEPVSAAERRQWRNDVAAQAMRLIDIVAGTYTAWQGKAATLARSLLDNRDRLAPVLDALDATATGGAICRIRVHGDFHLGQTLKTTDGFTLIDFEGEPAKSIAERRRKYCALKDVAGLLRSLDYADATARATRPALPVSAAAGLRRAFLDGYFSDPRLAAILPASRADCAPLLALFECEKALYEVEYELNNRPDWVPIPLAALLRFMAVPP